MASPEAVDGAAGALIAKQALAEIARRAVWTLADQHYFAVVATKGVADDLPHQGFEDVAKILCCPATKVHQLVAEHIAGERTRGGCKACAEASTDLKRLVTHERLKSHKERDSYSVFMLLSSIPPSPHGMRR